MTYNSSLIKSISLLDCYRSDTDEYGIGDFNVLTRQPESTVQRLVNTLEFAGILIQNPHNKKYRLSLRILSSIMAVQHVSQWLSAAKREMERLQTVTSETVNLGIRVGNELEYIAKVDTDQLLRPNFVLGKRYPLYCTGLGRCLLSDMAKDDLYTLFRNTESVESEFNELDFNRLYNTVLETRKQGYYLDDEEFKLGLYCIAVPIYAYERKVVAAISVSIPKARITEESAETILQETLITAKEISKIYEKIMETYEKF